MTTIRVDWDGADDDSRSQIQKHLTAIRELGAEVVEADVDELTQSAAQAICDYLASKNTGEGHVVTDRDIVQLKLPNGPLNPRQQGVLQEAFNHLLATGILVEGSDGKGRLTAAGAQHLYP